MFGTFPTLLHCFQLVKKVYSPLEIEKEEIIGAGILIYYRLNFHHTLRTLALAGATPCLWSGKTVEKDPSPLDPAVM